MHCTKLAVLIGLGFAGIGLTAPALATQQASPVRGTPLSVTTLKHFSRAEIEKQLGERKAYVGTPRCDVRLVEVVYATVGVHQEPAKASQMLLLPEGADCQGPAPLLGWARGTETRRDSAQAELLLANGNSPLMSFFASQGYIVSATDYLGLGKSDYPFHPYLHSDSEASAVIDALRAARRAGASLGARFSGKVMLAGYSQGGHAAMAAQRAIERDDAREFDLVASAPMSGPYALQQTFLDAWPSGSASGSNALAPYLFAYATVSMEKVYGNLYQRPQELFQQPYASAVESLMPGSEGIFELVGQNRLPMDKLRQPAFTHDFMANADNPLRLALARNDLLDWKPRTPTVLCGARRDTVVEFKNAQIASRAFARQGVKVPVIDVDDKMAADVDGVHAHTQWGVYLCLGAVRRALLDPAR
ncbi:lipase family protein [Enterobacterales bacterium BD_CKDN230030183-1A_HGKHYDSX7]